MSYDGRENLAPGSGALTYTVLTAEARRQAALPRSKARGRRETDVRTAPWWRVRTLRRISGLSILVPAVIYAVLVPVIFALVGDSSPVPQALLLLLVSVGLALYGGSGLRRGGGARARALARAACAPGPVSKRYALLYGPPWGGAALLVLFPAGGDDHVRPEAVLELWSPPLPRSRFPGNADSRPICRWSPWATW